MAKAIETLTTAEKLTFRDAIGVASKLITITRDLSLATGSVAYAGVGFTPTSLQIIGVVDSTASGSQGCADSTLAGSSVTSMAGGTRYNWATQPFAMAIDGSNYQAATLTSYDADGFTLSWTKTGAPTGVATFHVLCRT